MNNKAPLKNSGFSLLEVLISLVIMSVGMMGLAGLKVVSIKGANDSHFRQETTLLMMDLANRMRANPIGVDEGDYESHNRVSIDSEPTKDCRTVFCEPDDLATYDMYRVAYKMSLVAPGSSVSITCPSNDCKTTPAVEEVRAPDGTITTPAADAKKKVHTIEVKWKVRKQTGEDTTLDNSKNDKEFHIRSMKLEITP